MGSLLCLLVEALCPLELRPLDWQSLKSWEQEAKVLLSGSLSKIVGGTTPLSTTDPWTWESWIWEKQHHTLHVDSEHIEPSGKPYPSLTRYQCLADAIESSKDHSAVISRQLLQVGGETQLEFQWLPWDGSVTALLWLWSESLGQKQCVEYHGSGRGILYVQENSWTWFILCLRKDMSIWLAPLWLKVAQSGPTLCDSMDYTVHGILQVKILEWVAFPFSRGSFQLRDQTQVSHIADGFFTSWATREAS